MLKGKNRFQGRSAELAAMAEIAVRGYLVAEPEAGDAPDLLVGTMATSILMRVEVKSGPGKKYAPDGDWMCYFRLRPSLFLDDEKPELHFVFAPRIQDRWEFIVISRSDLMAMLPDGYAPAPSGVYCLKFAFNPTAVRGPGDRDFQPYRNHWDRYFPRRETV